MVTFVRSADPSFKGGFFESRRNQTQYSFVVFRCIPAAFRSIIQVPIVSISTVIEDFD
jgi:hypothetical protein